jgi:hypothetical protein
MNHFLIVLNIRYDDGVQSWANVDAVTPNKVPTVKDIRAWERDVSERSHGSAVVTNFVPIAASDN